MENKKWGNTLGEWLTALGLSLGTGAIGYIGLDFWMKSQLMVEGTDFERQFLPMVIPIVGGLCCALIMYRIMLGNLLVNKDKK